MCAACAQHYTFSFYMCASMCVNARLMTPNLSFRTLMYTLIMCGCTHQIWIMHFGMRANCMPRTAV